MQQAWVVLSRMPAALLVVVTTSTLAHAQASRRDVDEAFAKSIAGSHACGGTYRTVYDWSSYDALDWSHHDKSKQEQLDYELSNVEVVGAGLDQVCGDQDCKAVLGRVDTIVYRATADDLKHALDAQVSGHTLTFVNYVFGDTRDGTDYYRALKRGCATATLPDAPADTPSPSKPKSLGKPSAKWDATYAVDPALASVITDLCQPSSATALKVSHGKFSLPWYAQDWTKPESEAKPVRVGHIDGVVHDDGTATVAMVWDARTLAVRDVRTVRVKRALDAIETPSVRFKVVGKDKEVRLALDVDDVQCELGWAIRAPRPKTRAPVIYGNGVKWSKARMNAVREFESGKDSWDYGSIRKSRGEMGYGEIATAYRCDRRSGCEGKTSGWTPIGYVLVPW